MDWIDVHTSAYEHDGADVESLVAQTLVGDTWKRCKMCARLVVVQYPFVSMLSTRAWTVFKTRAAMWGRVRTDVSPYDD